MLNAIDRFLSPLVWTAVLILCTIGTWFLVIGHEKISDTGNLPRGNEPIGDIPPAVVDQPVLEETSADGSVRWTLYLNRIVREEGSVMELANPRALYRMKSGEILEVSGETGSYDEEKGILTLNNNVVGSARTREFGFSTDKLVWNNKEGSLDATGGIVITREGVKFSGKEFKLNLAKDFAHIEITGGVDISSNVNLSGSL